MDTHLIDSVGTSRLARQQHILVVDDDAADRERVANYLIHHDLRVTSAASGERMLEILRDQTIDLVALEITLRGEDGLHLARRLREIRPNLPVLLATGYSEAAADARGDFPILRKPYEIHQLSQAIASLPR